MAEKATPIFDLISPVLGRSFSGSPTAKVKPKSLEGRIAEIQNFLANTSKFNQRAVGGVVGAVTGFILGNKRTAAVAGTAGAIFGPAVIRFLGRNPIGDEIDKQFGIIDAVNEAVESSQKATTGTGRAAQRRLERGDRAGALRLLSVEQQRLAASVISPLGGNSFGGQVLDFLF